MKWAKNTLMQYFQAMEKKQYTMSTVEGQFFRDWEANGNQVKYYILEKDYCHWAPEQA